MTERTRRWRIANRDALNQYNREWVERHNFLRIGRIDMGDIFGYVAIALIILGLISTLAHAQVFIQPGVRGGLIVAAPLAGGGAVLVQPGTQTPPTIVVPFAGGGALITQPPDPGYVSDDTDATDGSDGGDSEGTGDNEQ